MKGIFNNTAFSIHIPLDLEFINDVFGISCKCNLCFT